MGFFTKAEARQAAQNKIQKSYTKKTASQILNEGFKSAGAYDEFDVFLSHSIKDAELVLGVKNFLESSGLKVYVDWHDDPHLSRDQVTKETAEILRKRMRQSKSLVYISTENSTGSKWMPWELGYFDGYRADSVAILPLLDYSHSSFSGQEYLGLYPVVTKDKYTGGAEDIFVEEWGNRWTTLSKFGKGVARWQKYGN